jgi:TonB family protein
MRLQFTFVFILCSSIGYSQSDTIAYFSKLNKVVRVKKDAFYYSELKHEKDGNLILRGFTLNNNKWENDNETSIRKETDTSYSFFQLANKKQIYVRSFSKTESGFYIRDYLNSKPDEEGLSKTIFPLIRYGRWKQYDQLDGKLLIDAEYKDNQLITNRYWNPDGSCITDVFTYVDKTPKYEGGDSGLLKFIAENTKYPEQARENNITGKVILSFVLMNDGSIQGIRFLQKVNFLLDFEALRVINSIPANLWKPAEIDNKKVNMPVAIPINFSIH